VENLNILNTVGVTGYGNALRNTIWGNIGNDSLYGNAGNDSLYGGAGNDFLSGGAGNDTMYGGAGDDIYFVGSTGDAVCEEADAGIDTVNLFSLTSYALGPNVERLNIQNTTGARVYGNDLNNSIWGITGNDSMYGGDGNDSLYGGAGNDYMNGGTGNDIYFVGSVGDVVYEAYGAGIDTVNLFTLTSYTLGANVEKLNIQNTAGASVYGNNLNNSLWGNAGNDYLYGGAGVDTYGFQGAFGRDTIGAATNNNMDIIDFSAFTSTSASVSIGGNGGDDLIVTIGTNRLIIADWNQGGGYQLNTFIFSDGTKSTDGSGWL
jgi:Ca2+-binding RTX toxin-like protein